MKKGKKNNSQLDDFDNFFEQMSTPEGRRDWNENFEKGFKRKSELIAKSRKKMAVMLSSGVLGSSMGFGLLDRGEGKNLDVQPPQLSEEEKLRRAKEATARERSRRQRAEEQQREAKEREARARDTAARERKRREETEEQYRRSEQQRKQNERTRYSQPREKPINKIEKAYRTLSLEPGATIQEIKKTYKEWQFLYHPDRAGNNLGAQRKAEEKFKEISEAFSILQKQLGFK